ncbi:MAG: biopolymer transporter ExbD [Elusimicrobia bacterium]|nr:biopolymer transporter ExbD [Elusimicrobiota bacterium]
MPSPFERREEAAPISDVNVVPLADVSLVLLILLLVLSPMAAQSMLRVQAAAAKEKADAGPRPGVDPLMPSAPLPVLAVGLNSFGYVVDGRLLATEPELDAWLSGELARRPDPADRKVFLSPDLDVPNGRVVSAIEALRRGGAPEIALVQIRDPEDAAPAGAAGASR